MTKKRPSKWPVTCQSCRHIICGELYYMEGNDILCRRCADEKTSTVIAKIIQNKPIAL